MNYANGKIYRLQCVDGHFYIGSTTTELRKRLAGHKMDSKRPRYDNSKVYTYIRTITWDQVRIELLECYPCENKQQLVRREDDFIRQYRDDPLCLNTNFADANTEERLNEKKQYKYDWYRRNREELLEKAKEYQINNKDKRRQWVEANKDHLREYEKRRVRSRKIKSIGVNTNDGPQTI